MPSYSADTMDRPRSSISSPDHAAADFPPARPHGAIREVFPDVFFVTGTMRFPGPVAVCCSRSMTIVRDGRSLTLVNTVRLDETGLAALDELGSVEHVVRLAGFHGSDDPFYKARYGATVWTVKNQPYARGFDLRPPPEKIYFRADREMDATSELPLPGRLHTFPSSPIGEGLLLLEREGGILMAGDVLQNWSPDPYFNWLGRLTLRLMGFFRPCNVGPGWLKQTKPAPEELASILDLDFSHVLPSHGSPVVGNARESYRPAIESAVAWAQKARG